MATLDGIADIAQALDDRGVSVDTTLCVKARNRNATCQRCVEACNRGCITWESEGLAFDPENCNDCGACVSACPTGALSSRWKGDSQVYASCLQAAGHCEGDVVIACNVMLERAGKLVDQRKVAGVPCLERVSAELLAAVAVFSRASRVVLVHGACEECERLTGAEATCQMVEQVRSLLASWDYDVRLKVSGKLPGKVRMADDEGFDSSRRAFFAGMRDKARDAASTSVRVATKDMFEGDEEPVPAKPHVNRFGVLPPGTSGKREYLLAAVDALGTPACDFIDSPLWARVAIDTAQCVACRMCVPLRRSRCTGASRRASCATARSCAWSFLLPTKGRRASRRPSPCDEQPVGTNLRGADSCAKTRTRFSQLLAERLMRTDWRPPRALRRA